MNRVQDYEVSFQRADQQLERSKSEQHRSFIEPIM